MTVTFSKAWSLLAVCVVLGALVSCTGADPDPDPSSETPPSAQSTHGDADELKALNDLAESAAAAASEDATQAPTLLIVNKTPHAVVLTSEEGESTTTIGPGRSVRLASERACGQLPLTASTAGGRVLDEYAEPCHGQTWTITGG